MNKWKYLWAFFKYLTEGYDVGKQRGNSTPVFIPLVFHLYDLVPGVEVDVWREGLLDDFIGYQILTHHKDFLTLISNWMKFVLMNDVDCWILFTLRALLSFNNLIAK